MILIADDPQSQALGLRHKYNLTADPAAPLIYLVHGRAGTFDVMWTFARCIPESFNIIAPEAFLPDPVGGFSWWPVDGSQNRQSIDDGVNRLRTFIDSAEEHFALTPRTRIALGFSQGAGLLSCLLQKEPGLFSQVGLLAGFVIDCGGPQGGGKLPRILMAHGSQDPVISLEKAKSGAELLRQYGAEIEFHEDDVTHKVGTAGMRALKSWLATKT
jgi:phospholipase/carboxylesterase